MYVTYVFSPWGPGGNASKLELLFGFAFLGFPMSFLCFSSAYLWGGGGIGLRRAALGEFAFCVVLSLLSLWLTMLQPWNLITRVGAAGFAVFFGFVNLFLAKTA